jgi:Icc-related predicted phosphoesterase
VIRIAAVADVHFGLDSAGTLRPHLERLNERADLLLVAGDMTTCGDPREAEVLAGELGDASVPVVAVLGNHDYHLGREQEVTEALLGAGVHVLEGDSFTTTANGTEVGVAGVKGFMGGFAGASGADFGEPEMKALMRVTKSASERLEELLRSLSTGIKIALIHYAPVKGTLLGERLELYPFLGSYLLGEAVDRAGADLILHGHAHAGTEKGITPGGIRVRNVAQPVIRQAYNLYELE